MIKTSLTHPLQIAEIVMSDGGRIGITFCPGKKQPFAVSGTWDRDLTLDVQAIANWGAGTVLTLIEDHEFRSLRVEELGDAVRAHGMDWVHLPIPDASIPDAEFETAWIEIGAMLRSRLRAGAGVLVHCKGGLGRAGMIAARLLVELGMPADKAIAKVRHVRPGAIETLEQEDRVRAVAPIPGPSMT